MAQKTKIDEIAILLITFSIVTMGLIGISEGKIFVFMIAVGIQATLFIMVAISKMMNKIKQSQDLKEATPMQTIVN